VSPKRSEDKEKEREEVSLDKGTEKGTVKEQKGEEGAEGTEAKREAAAEEAAEKEVVLSVKELEDLRKELETKKAEAAEYLDHLQRLKAEFENYKKRLLREQTQFLELASQNLMGKLLPVLDNFELALLAAEDSQDFERLVKGIEMVYSEFKDVLHKEGLQVIESIGKQFDPQVHEAVMQVHSDEHEDNTVIDVLRQGYTFKGKIIRPAMVKVAKR